jgi:hypothetical protein
MPDAWDNLKPGRRQRDHGGVGNEVFRSGSGSSSSLHAGSNESKESSPRPARPPARDDDGAPPPAGRGPPTAAVTRSPRADDDAASDAADADVFADKGDADANDADGGRRPSRSSRGMSLDEAKARYGAAAWAELSEVRACSSLSSCDAP